MNYKKIFAALTAAGILAARTPAKKYLAVLYLSGSRNNAIDIKVLEKP